MDEILTFFLYTGLIFAVSYCMNEIEKTSKKGRYLKLAILATICAVFSAGRGELGTDTNMYMGVYQNGIGSLHRWVDFEWGFQLLVKAFQSLSLPYVIFSFFINFLSIGFFFLAIDNERNKINVFMATFLCMIDFYFLSWNIIRQALAMAIAIYAICKYLDGYRKWAFLLIICASSFHTSALICFAVIIAEYAFENNNYKIILTVCVAVTFFFVLNRDLLSQIVFLITKEEYYASYFSRDAETSGSLITYFIKVLPILLVAILGRYKYDRDDKYKTVFSLMIIGYVLSSIGSVTATQVQRIGYYFTYLNCFVVGLCTNSKFRLWNKCYLSKRDVVLLIVAFELMLFIFNRFYKGYAELVPYPWFG